MEFKSITNTDARTPRDPPRRIIYEALLYVVCTLSGNSYFSFFDTYLLNLLK